MRVTSKKSGQDYFLHTKIVLLAGKRKQRIYWFAKAKTKDALHQLPEGYEVFENPRTGLPMLRKKK